MNCICRFKNDPCAGSSNRNGTCYTESECSNKGGTNAGSCAQVSYSVAGGEGRTGFMYFTNYAQDQSSRWFFFHFRASECVAYVSTKNKSNYALVFLQFIITLWNLFLIE